LWVPPPDEVRPVEVRPGEDRLAEVHPAEVHLAEDRPPVRCAVLKFALLRLRFALLASLR
jgi:hypothetical protein